MIADGIITLSIRDVAIKVISHEALRDGSAITAIAFLAITENPPNGIIHVALTAVKVEGHKDLEVVIKEAMIDVVVVGSEAASHSIGPEMLEGPIIGSDH